MIALFVVRHERVGLSPAAAADRRPEVEESVGKVDAVID
jgi:hypothetical protein